MSAKNKELIQKINKAFSKGDIGFVLAHLTEDVKWNIVGLPVINGKDDFLNAMKMMEYAVRGFPDSTVKKIIAEGNYVVVESTGNIKSGIPYNPSYCDVYRLKDGKIQELSTYVVDITLNEDAKS